MNQIHSRPPLDKLQCTHPPETFLLKRKKTPKIRNGVNGWTTKIVRSNNPLHITADITADNVRERARQGVEAVMQGVIAADNCTTLQDVRTVMQGVVAADNLTALAPPPGNAFNGGWVDHGKGWIEWIGHSERNDHFLDREENPPDGGPRIRMAEVRPRGPRPARQSGDRRRGRPRPYRGSTGATMAQWTAAATAVGIPPADNI